MSQHYYHAVFHMRCKTEKNSFSGYILAQNAQEAYRKAQKICAAQRVSFPGLRTTCRHNDITCRRKDAAEREIASGTKLFQI